MESIAKYCGHSKKTCLKCGLPVAKKDSVYIEKFMIDSKIGFYLCNTCLEILNDNNLSSKVLIDARQCEYE